jgi:hypothetical protein
VPAEKWLKFANIPAEFAMENNAMRSNLVPWLGAMALSISITGLSSAPIDLSLQPGTMQATGSVQPPTGLGLNKKGLEALKSAGGQPTVSGLSSKDMPSSIAKIGTDDMIRRPDSAENQLQNNLLSGSNKATTENMVLPPSK